MYYSLRFPSLSLRVAIFTILPIIAPDLTSAQSNRSDAFYPIIDFDGDGSSDLTLFEDQNDGSPNEYVFHTESSESGETSSIEFGNSNDERALGDYDGDGRTDLTIVREENSALFWLTRDSNGDTTSTEWGVSNDLILSGCDLDGDGTSDPAIVRSTELMYRGSSNGNTTTPLAFAEGESVALASCGDINGDGTWETVFVLSTEETYRLAVFNNLGEELYSVATKEPSDIIIYDANGDSTPDIGLMRKLRRNRVIFLYTQGDSMQFTRSKIRLGRRVHEVSPQLNSETGEWTLLFIGKKNRLFRYDTESQKVRRENSYLISGEDILTPTELNTSGSGIREGEGGACTSIEPFEDGYNSGRLCKQAEHGGTVVLISQCDYRARKVRLMKDGQVLYNLVDTGLANPSICGLRSHFRARDRNLSSFPREFIVEVTDTRGNLHCYLIDDNNGKRID